MSLTHPVAVSSVAFSPRPEARTSDAIAIARVLCILGVVYVHAWTGLDSGALLALKGSGQETLRWTLMETFGRSAVPLLGLISGWLVAGSSRVRNFGPHVAHKARTILLPMLLWNAIAIILVSGAALFAGLQAPVPHSAEWMAQELLILTRNPDINVQMPFLRDLFLCMVAAPLLARAPNWMLASVAALAGGAFILGYGPPVLMRASILMFFAIGMIARRTGADTRVANLPWAVAVLPFLLLLPLKVHVSLPGNGFAVAHAQMLIAIDLSVRLAATLAMWRIACALAASGASTFLKRIEPYMFFMFCSHLIFMWLVAPMIGRLTGPLGSPAYPALLVLQPALALASAAVLAKGLMLIAPELAGILSGGRLKGSRPRIDGGTVMTRPVRLQPAR